MKLNLQRLEQIEEEMRRGNSLVVREFLQSVSRNEIPDSLILRVCQLARRIDYANKGLLLLRERVLDLPSSQEPDARELCEYAACLIKVGANAEALRLLQRVNTQKAPEALKFMGFACIHQWDYPSAILHLTKYIESLDASSYEHLIGSLNLAASLVTTEQLDQAHTVLVSIRERAQQGGHTLVLGNTYELLAQIEIQRGNYDDALNLLSLASSQLTTAPARYQLYIEKWHAVIALLRREENASAALKKVRQKAVESHEWEVIRDCDFYESIESKNSEMFLHLYFGTPHPQFRARMLRKANGAFLLPDKFSVGSSNRIFDISSGKVGSELVIKKGQALHKIATALLMDFYSPASVAQLFAKVFESEQFHPESSPHRVQELVRRLRDKLAAANVPLEIISVERGYKLSLDNLREVAVQVTADRNIGLDLLNVIKSTFGDSQFSLRELTDVAGIPHTTLYRQIKDCVEAGTIASFGSAKNTRYQLATSILKKVVSK